MRLHKRVVLREKHYGKWWTVYAVKQKVITMTDTSIESILDEMIRGKLLRAAIKIKNRKTFQVPFELAQQINDRIAWKGEWGAVRKSTKHYPTKPHGRLL